jgi:uncharacterized membrane protein
MKMTRSAFINILSNLVALAAVIAVLRGVHVPMFMSYIGHKMLHIFGVILFVGNISVGPLWLLVAYFRRDGAAMRYVVEVLSMADIVFTVPGVQLALWNGLAMAGVFPDLRQQPWLYQSLLLLISLSLLGPTVVLYYQEKLVRLSRSGVIDGAFRSTLYWWSAWGMLLFIPIGLIFYLMISKQRLW